MEFKMLERGKKYLVSIFYSLLFISSLLFSQNSFTADSLSYSGRLVKADGSPVAGPVDLTIDLAYTNTPATILCSQNFPAVVLSNGVFHLKLDLVCPGPPVKTLTEILTAVPATFAAALRVTDVTNNKIYSFQALHAMPFSSISETAKQLVQLGAANGQVLKWNDTTKKWEPGTPGGGGTVTNVTVTSPLAIINGATTPDLSIAKATTSTDGYLSATDWNAFNNKIGVATGGTTAQYYRGDNSWQTLNSDAVPVGVSNLYFTNALALGVPLGASLNVGLTGDITSADTILSAFGRTQKQLSSLATASSSFLIKDATDSVTGEVTINFTTGSLLLPRTPSDAELTQAANVNYVKTYADTKLPLSGGTLTNDLTLNTQAKFKGGLNFVELKADASLPATISLTLPMTIGGNGDVLTSNGAGVMSWTTPASSATPSGAAGGDLTGTYPNPTIVAVPQAKVTGLTAALAAKQSTTLSSGNFLVGNVGNVATAVVMSGDATLSNTGALALKNTGSAGTYTSVTTDAQGRVTAGTNPVAVTSISATAPVIVTGTTSPVISMTAATTGVNGYLTSSDWNIFNLKQSALSNSAGLAAALSDETGSGLAVFNSAPTILNPVIANIAPLVDFTLTQNAVVPFTSVAASAVANTLYLKAGKVGIGTITPSQALDVVGNINGSQLCIAGTCKATWPTGVSTGVISDNEVSATANIAQSKISGLTTSLSGKEPVIAAGTSAQYLKGDKSWGTFASEVLATALTSLSTATNAVITASDSVLSAFGKLQAQVTNLVALDANKLSKNSADSITAVITVSGGGDLLVPSTPAGMTSAVNKTYVDTSISNNGVWAKVGSDINYGAGKVGIGTTTPTSILQVSDIYTNTLDSTGLGISIFGSANDYGGLTLWDRDGNPATTNDGDTTLYWGDDVGESLRFAFKLSGAALSEKMRILSNGNVGIGTTSPISPLHAYGGTAMTAGYKRTATFHADHPAIQFKGISDTNHSGGIGYDSQSISEGMRFWVGATSDDLHGTGVLAMSIKANGNVGIGTTAPAEKLEIAGRAYANSYELNASSGFSGGTRTGIAAPAAVTLGLYSNGNERMRIDGTGNVGIGTTTPVNLFEVQKNFNGLTNVNAAFIGGIDSGYTNTGIYIAQKDATSLSSNSTYLLNAVQNGISKMVVTGAGNVGIGTSSPAYKLDVSTNIARLSSANASYTAWYIANTGTGHSLTYYDAIDGDFAGGDYGYVGQRNEGYMEYNIASSSPMPYHVFSGGNVGIGTTSPAAKLNIGGIGAVDGTALRIDSQDTYKRDILFTEFNTTDYGGIIRYDSGADVFQLLTIEAGVEKKGISIVRSTGNVGIGTATPSSLLHVSANAPSSYTSMAIENTAAGGNKWSFLASSTGASLGANKMCLETGGICRVSIDTVGNMTIGGTLTQSSDLRLKRDFKLLPHALESLSTLKGLTYYWSDPNRSKERQIGLIAQDVEKVFPEVVYTDAQGFKSVAYQSLVAPMIEAFKEIRNWMFGVDKKLDSHDRAIASQGEEIKKLRDEVRESHQENEQLKKDIAEIKKALGRK